MPHTPATTRVEGELVFLGTGTSMGVPVIGCDCPTCTSEDARNRRTRCGVVVGLPEGNLLVDTPTELRMQLVRERIGIIHAVLFTHDHADHIFGLDDLRLFPYYLGRRLSLYTEPLVEQRIRKSFDYAFEQRAQQYAAGGVPQLDFVTIGEDPFEVLGARVIPVRLKHGRFDVLGFRFGNVAYCTDTNSISPDNMAKLQDLDVLIIDALRSAPHPTHFSLEEAVALAEELSPGRTVFTHMSHDLEHVSTNASLPAGMELAYDGMRIPLS